MSNACRKPPRRRAARSSAAPSMPPSTNWACAGTGTAPTYEALATDRCERSACRGYLESEQAHLLRAYDADFLTDAILACQAALPARVCRLLAARRAALQLGRRALGRGWHLSRPAKAVSGGRALAACPRPYLRQRLHGRRYHSPRHVVYATVTGQELRYLLSIRPGGRRWARPEDVDGQGLLNGEGRQDHPTRSKSQLSASASSAIASSEACTGFQLSPSNP